MKKKKVVHYTIADPCHEGWSSMTPTVQGRFCSSCEKTVVDFTSMADFEIMKYMTAAKGSVCGRMKNTQLNRDFTQYEAEQSRSFSVQALVLGAALSTFSAVVSHAQVTTTPVERPYNETRRKMGIMKAIEPAATDSTLHGSVKDSGHQAIGGVKVTLYDAEKKELAATVTDEKGNYTLPLNASGSYKSGTLTFIAPGFLEERLAFPSLLDRLGMVILYAREEVIDGGIEMHEGPADSPKSKKQ